MFADLWHVIAIVQVVGRVRCQLADNTPPYMYLDRNWQIYDTEQIGSKIAQVHGNDAENGQLIYGLEPLQFFGSKKPPDKLPFRIDRDTGAVYLNESLKGRAGENLHLYVTVSDGELAAKTEVYVNILNASSPLRSSPKRPAFPPSTGVFPPGFINYPGFNSRPAPIPQGVLNNLTNNPPSSITNNPSTPHFQQKAPKITQLKPVEGVDAEEKGPSRVGTTSTATIPKKDVKEESVENDLGDDYGVRESSEIGSTVVPIMSVLAVFFTVGVLAAIFRKRIYLGKTKKSKEDMSKEPSAPTSDNQGINMQEWRGPRAFSNRYEPWQSNYNHMQVATQASETVKPIDRWEFPRHHLKFFKILGEGAFGQVWKCEAQDLEGKDSGSSIVAVKTLKENASEKERLDLVSELQVMKMLEPHPNVVKLLGCCTEKEPIFLIMEYVTKGKLQSYLRSSRAERYYNNMHGKSNSLTSRDLTSFCYQVAKGMEFLSSNGIIHRDLAARNILITEDHTCKVADFGFARDVISSLVYERKSEGRLPIRWMAPESLYDNIFSVKSDIWSFGVLIWEVVTLGSTPYPGLSAAEVMKKVKDGYRLDKPEHCRRELYNIMYYCWDKDPRARPSFAECIELLEKLLLTETDYIELERFPDHSYYNMLSLSGEKL
ncbi:tyrosine kinase receptor Cad96Ca-like [Cylas formicarius]|uniref:tyrosine kinase receptor Cad96Ca-like n=1 Tax=Cylas formicarius TaxID=197179 RepID=UPI002958DEBA|nr:tyrosine kinase receptor Cad96Ca-like [Cylas formicarius]